MKSHPHVLIVTLDSCRWDSFARGADILRKWGEFRCAYSQATYTLPAHISIYHGILPNTQERLPYYNRFEKNLFRISGRSNSEASSLITFPSTVKNIVHGFAQIGYGTLGIGAVEWFKKEVLREPFAEFIFTGIDLDSQLRILSDHLEGRASPLMALLNVGETHDPYEYGGKIEPSLRSRERMRSSERAGFLHTEFKKQVEASAWIATRLHAFFTQLEELERPTLTVVCGDHGECFGESGMYGHGFYHPKIMEVPLGIFCIGREIQHLRDFIAH